MRVFLLSDVHAHHAANMRWLANISFQDYINDVLLLAGDIAEKLDTLEEVFPLLNEKFARVFFVPGNHEFWIRKKEAQNSLFKFNQVMALCDSYDVITRPTRVGGENGVWIVPLFSWYVRPEEGDDSLFAPKLGEAESRYVWSDDYFIKWPKLGSSSRMVDYFLDLNESRLSRGFDAPVISFSHFLPRRDLIYSTKEELEAGLSTVDPNPSFNFSRVAGSTKLDEQIRHLGSVVHAYGHQHRNRTRMIDGIQYVSFCLGYPRERENGHVIGVGNTPKLIWDTEASPASR